MLDMIGDRLKELRLERNLGQPEFGAIAGTTKQYVWRLENGLNKKPNPEYIQRWASHFQVRMEWITSGKLPKEASSPTSATGPGESQPQRPDFDIMAGTVIVLRKYLHEVGDPPDFVEDPIMLEAAYEVVIEFGKPVTGANVIDLTKILEERVRRAKDGEDQVRGTGTKAGGKKR